MNHEQELVSFTSHFRVTEVGLDIIGEPSYDECERLWKKLHKVRRGLQFAIGDAAKYIRGRFGEKADQILSDVTGWTPETLRTYEWTSESVAPANRRMDVLEYSHHQAVARLAPRDQKRWLTKAAEDETPWSVARLKKAVKHDVDAPVSMWVLVVYCDSEAKRDRLEREMISNGHAVKTGERRGEKKS